MSKVSLYNSLVFEIYTLEIDELFVYRQKNMVKSSLLFITGK